jgi:ABC-type branched-subunit amino acid transport system permease subunit
MSLAGLLLLVNTSGGHRTAVELSLVFAVLALSQVVITGLCGQVSLAQLALAGVGAFSLIRLTSGIGMPSRLLPWPRQPAPEPSASWSVCPLFAYEGFRLQW